MAFKNYTLTTAAGTQQTLCTADSTTDIAIVSIQVYGGSQGGTVTFTKKLGASQIFKFVLPVKAQETVAIDHKIFVPAGYTYTATGSASGMQICANAMQMTV